MENITLKEVLAAIDSGKVIDEITFVTYNAQKKTGGELITIRGGRKHNWLSPAEREKIARTQPTSSLIKKDPRHYENSTRNIMILHNREIRKIHIRLIRKFNGKTVL
ncbi:MAG: hypothetical protein ACTHMV_13550 [Chitinophagaceae bacterium]